RPRALTSRRTTIFCRGRNAPENGSGFRGMLCYRASMPAIGRPAACSRSRRRARPSAVSPGDNDPVRLFLKQEIHDCLLPVQLVGKGMAQRAPVRAVGGAVEPGLAMPVILPARVVEDRIQAYALHGHPGGNGRSNLVADIMKPRRPRASL